VPIVDGCPPGLALSSADLQPDLDRRKPGTSRFTTQRREATRCGSCPGFSRGSPPARPIGLLIENTDQRSRDYANIADRIRPAHADYTYMHKYGRRDYRGGGRSSARETAMRVAAGAIAKKYLALSRHTYTRLPAAAWGRLRTAPGLGRGGAQSLLLPRSGARFPELETYMARLNKRGDSIGARINVVAEGVPPGLGEPIFDRLDADIAAAMMGINAVKAVEIGAGFSSVTQQGSEHRDDDAPGVPQQQRRRRARRYQQWPGHHVVSMALKPTSSIRQPGASISHAGEAIEVVTTGRHDPCVGIRATPIAEAMLALVLIDHFLRQRAQNGEVTSPTPAVPGRRD
jgi:chorismate synthase